MRFAGVVPASGSSRRMGKPKAGLALGGQTFLQRVVDALGAGGCAPVFVVTTSDVAEAVEEALHRDDAGRGRFSRTRVVDNPSPEDGPISSLRRALDSVGVECRGVAYLPLDFPLVAPTVVAELLAAARRSGAPLTLPTHGSKRGHPAIFRRSLFRELLDPTLEGGARTVVHRHLETACLVPFDDRAVVTDVDTPEVYAEVVRAFEERNGP